MKKISKKIVSLVTLAAFALTLVPAAAFAANSSSAKVEAVDTTSAKVTINVSDADLGTGNIVVWATDNNNENAVVQQTNVQYSDVKGTDKVSNYENWLGSVVLQTPTKAGEISVKATFSKPGSYTMHVGLNNASGTPQETDPVAFDGPAIYNNSNGDRQTSYFVTKNANVTVDTNKDVSVAFEVNDNNNKPTSGKIPQVLVWATEKGADIEDASSAFVVNGETADPENSGIYSLADVVSGEKTVKFTRPGEYVLHAGVGDTVAKASKALLKSVENQNTVIVEAEEAGDVNGLTISDATPVGDKEFDANGTIKPNDTATKTHTVTATIDGFAAQNENFKITTSSSNIKVTAKNMNGNAFDAGTATTDRNGKFQITYKVAKAGNYKIYLTSEDGYKVTLNVTTDGIEYYPADMALADFDASVLNKDELNQGSGDKYLSDAVRFVITDNNGAEMTADDKAVVENEAAAKDDAGHNDYVNLSAPEKFDGKAEGFFLALDNSEGVNAYTLKYTGDADFVPGEYTVRVALQETGKYVDAKFTVGEFDANSVSEIKVVPSTTTITYDKGGEGFTYKVKAVDANGVTQDITASTDYSIGVNAVDVLDAKVNGTNVTFKSGITADEKDKYVGNVITLTAVSTQYHDIATAEVTVVDKGVVAGLAFDNEAGEADKTNKVGVSVVDADGNVVKNVEDGEIFAYVADQGNADANVDVNVTKNVKNGKDGEITIYSDKETTVDVVVAVKDGQALYADTLKYTVGAADVNADKLVAMTIGSSDYIVNNDVVKGDAAPYVDGNWRTMVPVRALAETFGAEVTFEDNVITIVDGDKTIVMTVGEEAYTVNDEEKTMDTVPVIGEGDRTFVPTRFVAEALGYTVTPLQDANGLTASVVFQK